MSVDGTISGKSDILKKIINAKLLLADPLSQGVLVLCWALFLNIRSHVTANKRVNTKKRKV